MPDTPVSGFPVVTTLTDSDYFPVIVASGPSNGRATLVVVFANHLAAADPHPQYLTNAEAALLYEALGSVASAIATHEADTTNVHGIANTANLSSIGVASRVGRNMLNF